MPFLASGQVSEASQVSRATTRPPPGVVPRRRDAAAPLAAAPLPRLRDAKNGIADRHFDFAAATFADRRD